MEPNSESRKRRSKKETQGRNHTCDCGKSYLSYQALYTHKRTKHPDRVSESDESRKKRGRPKGNCNSIGAFDPLKILGDHILSEKFKNFDETRQPQCCDDVFTEYLYENSKKLNKKEFKMTANSIFNLRNCVNKYYYKQENCVKEEDMEEFTELRMPTFLPSISNVFILKYLPETGVEYDLQAEAEFLLCFCKWLVEKNYTQLELSIIS